MKIHITKAGWGIVICLIIFASIFFIFGGFAAVSKIIEEWRVNSLSYEEKDFSNLKISSTSWDKLKQSFEKKYNKIVELCQKAKKLEESYPKNTDIKIKKKQYEKYRCLMENASFDCPDHKTNEKGSKKCSKCGGNGKKWILFSCKKCNGKGVREYVVPIKDGCPYCGGKKKKGKIKGKSILKKGELK